MKKTIILSIICSIIVSVSLISIPKHEIPTDTEWKEFLAWEQKFFEWRDGTASEQCVYQIQHRDTHTVYFVGSLQECKNNVTHYELTVGECVIMPYLPL